MTAGLTLELRSDIGHAATMLGREWARIASAVTVDLAYGRPVHPELLALIPDRLASYVRLCELIDATPAAGWVSVMQAAIAAARERVS